MGIWPCMEVSQNGGTPTYIIHVFDGIVLYKSPIFGYPIFVNRHELPIFPRSCRPSAAPKAGRASPVHGRSTTQAPVDMPSLELPNSAVDDGG